MLAALCADHGEKQVTGWRDMWERMRSTSAQSTTPSDTEKETSYDRRHLLNRQSAAPGDLTSPGPLEKARLDTRKSVNYAPPVSSGGAVGAAVRGLRRARVRDLVATESASRIVSAPE